MSNSTPDHLRSRPFNSTTARTCLLIIGATTFLSAGSALAKKVKSPVAPINTKFSNTTTYPQLGAEWEKWAYQTPKTDSPLLDSTGDKCRVGQHGSVWFLAGSSDGFAKYRECEIPSGTALFFPVINTGYGAFLNEPPDKRTAAFLRAQLASCTESSVTNLSVTIDGVAVANPAQYWTTALQSPLFQIQMPTDNVFGLDDTAVPELLLSPTVHKGIYLYVYPLAPGNHTIAWTADWNCGHQDIIYDLTVLPGVTGQLP